MDLTPVRMFYTSSLKDFSLEIENICILQLIPGIWLFAEKMVRDLSVTFSSVNVISGAIFDEDADGQRDEDSTITRLVFI